MTGQDLDVIVIGAGMTGIAAGYYLARSGLSFAILEARDEVGGVWSTQRWHGVRCDSDFIKYSFSFRPHLSPLCLQPGEAIRAYLQCVAEEFGLVARIRFGTRVLRAAFSTPTGRWSVETSRGSFSARFLMNGNGYFSEEPHVPAFKDAERFGGEIVHASRLDGRRTFHDKKVAVVGSGSTAICCAPALARVSKSVVIVQRSPSYIYEIDNRAGALARLCQHLYRLGLRFPVALLRVALQAKDDAIFVAFRRFPRAARWFFRRHWSQAVDARALERHFTPRYDPWEQRIPVAIGLKEQLRSGRIGIRTGHIERFTEDALVLSTGEVVECDVCVLATGLELEFFKVELHVDGHRVALDGINLYRGFMVGGVPNYFHPMGSWHSAWTQRAEPLIRLAVRIMRHMERRGLRTVAVERKALAPAPGITPGYVMRALAKLPRIHGTTNLPTIDNLRFTRLHGSGFSFS